MSRNKDKIIVCKRKEIKWTKKTLQNKLKKKNSKTVKRLNPKSKSVCGGCVELNYEVRLKDDNSAFVNQLEAMPGVSRVVLVSYNGDYMG